MTDIVEAWLQAMQIVASKNIEAIKFDITIQATIVDASQAEQGKYLVSTGSSRFYAFSTDQNYKENDTVMVTVPEGNYDNQKIILCKKVENNETAIPYQSPFGHMIDVTNNLIYGQIEKGIYANYNQVVSGCPWNTNENSFIDSAIFEEYIKSLSYASEEDRRLYCLWDSGELATPFSQYTRLGLKGQFSTWLDNYQTIAGNYGLCLMVQFQSQEVQMASVSTQEEEQEQNQNSSNSQQENQGEENNQQEQGQSQQQESQIEIQENDSFYNFFTLDSDSFYGDPYGFETYYTQEAVFDISEYQNYLIKRIVLFMYQRNNFKTLTGEDVESPSGEDFSTIVPNIYVKDPYVSLGYDSDSFVSDNLLIYTEDSLKYCKYPIEHSQDETSEYQIRNENNSKQVHFRWIHKDEKTGNVGAKQFLPENYEIRWYHKKIGAPSPDSFAGAHYENLTFVNGAENIESGGVAILQIDSNDEAENKIVDIVYYPNVNVQEDTIKAIIIKKPTSSETNVIDYTVVARSNLLTFENTDVVITSQDVIQTEALGIKCEDLQRGHYSIYGRNGKLLRDVDQKEVRYLTAVFDYSDTNLNLYTKSLLKEATSVKWYCPSKNTMIKPYIKQNKNDENDESLNFIKETDFVDDIYKCYTGNLRPYHSITGGINNSVLCYQFPYTIHPTLRHSYSNNTIRLEVIKDNITYTASITMTFNVAGTSGSAYTLDILWDNNDNVLDVSNLDDKIFGQIVLYDQEGQFVAIPDEAEIELDWYVATSSGSKDMYEENNDLLYPAFEGVSLEFGWPDDEEKTGVTYYYFDMIEGEHKYKEASNIVPGDFSANDRTRTLYRKRIFHTPLQEGDEKYKKKLKYKKIQLTAIDKENPKEEELAAFYEKKKNGYIKVDDLYIVNPYRTDSVEDIAALQDVDAYEVYESNEDLGVLNIAFEQITIENDETTESNEQITIENNETIQSKDRFNIGFKLFNDENLFNNENEFYMTKLNVLRVTLTNFGDYDLVALFPIPLKSGEDYQGIDGATYVRYNTLGECDYIKNPYALFKLENDNLVEVDGVTWDLFFDLSNNSNGDGQFAPGISDKQVLKPYPVYIVDANFYGVQAKINGNTVWSQPILVYQDNYPSTTLNQWNGRDIFTDSNSGVIVANGLAAGKKDKDNTFTGVVLGDWSRTDTDKDLTKNTGVYGLYKGAVSYALMDDGTAFFGQDGKGRITLNGISGTITGPGLEVDFQHGTISGQNFDLTGGSTLELHSSGNPAYFKIKNGNSTLINIDDDFYYLQSANYSAGEAGSNFNLNDGAFESQNATIRGTIYATKGTLGTLTVEGTLTGGTISGSTISGGSITIGNNFSVDSSGNMIATSANITGSINATSGTLHSLDVTGTLTFSGGTISGATIEGGSIRVPIGASTTSASYFIVDGDGNVFMSGGIKATDIDADQGTIGGWIIAPGRLWSNQTKLNSGNGHIETNYFSVTDPGGDEEDNLLGRIGNMYGSTENENGQYILTNLLGINAMSADGILLQADKNGENNTGNIRFTGRNIYIDINGFTGSLAEYILSLI